MHTRLSNLFPLFALLLSLTVCSCRDHDIRIEYTVSMEKPNTHYFHVTMRVNNLPGCVAEFKLPNWTPGYYLMMDYAKNVTAFTASGADGRPLNRENEQKYLEGLQRENEKCGRRIRWVYTPGVGGRSVPGLRPGVHSPCGGADVSGRKARPAVHGPHHPLPRMEFGVYGTRSGTGIRSYLLCPELRGAV